MLLIDKLNIGSKREFTDEGFLMVPARISRVGIQEYTAIELGLNDSEPNKVLKIFRPEKEVFNESSMKSFANKPVTDNHPAMLVDSTNAKEFMVGMSGHEITKDGDFVSAQLVITDAIAIKNIEDGKVELSNGYTCDIDWTSGTNGKNEQFDAIQRNIKGNHIALVTKGRAGSDCRLADTKHENKNNMKVTIDGVDYEVSDQACQAVSKLQKTLADAQNELSEKEKEAKDKDDELEEAKKKAKKTTDALQAKLDDAESNKPTAKQLDQMVSDRSTLIDNVRKIKPDIELKDKDELALKTEAICHSCPGVQMDSKSKDYIDARFDAILDSIGSNSQQRLDDAFKDEANRKVKDEDDRPEDIIARDKFNESTRDAWKGGKKS